MGSDFEQVELGLQQLFSDALIRSGVVTRERDVSRRATIFNMSWSALQRPVHADKTELGPKGFWDYFTQYIPFMTAEKRYLTTNLYNRCPHLDASEGTHLDWMVNGNAVD